MDHRTRLTAIRAAQRLAARDASLFADPAVAAERLGWIGLPARAAASADALARLGREVADQGITDVVVLGMGGSSLAPLVLSRILGGEPGRPVLHVLDTTSPAAVTSLTAALRPSTTLVVVSSKSGTTIEPLALAAIFRQWMTPELEATAGAHFMAVTDPGSALEAYAAEHSFARLFHAPSDVGGRYAALTPFAMVPAALIGVDVARLAAAGASMEAACLTDTPANPGLELAAWLADAYAGGRDKLTIVISPEYAAFGLWVEQLVAESTGKGGRGLLPVLEAAPGAPSSHGGDRMTFVMRRPDDDSLAALAARLPAGEPVLEVVLDDAWGIGGEFVRWEWAIALFSVLAGIEPFDQPNVAEAKAATQHILARRDDGVMGDVAITADSDLLVPALRELIVNAAQGSYFAVLAYLPDDPALLEPLASACAELAVASRSAVTLEVGPRYLHSTGQYHKGGPGTGHFLVMSAGSDDDVDVPGEPYTLGMLNRAQAEGDVATLRAHGRPVVFVTIPAADRGAVDRVANALRTATGA